MPGRRPVRLTRAKGTAVTRTSRSDSGAADTQRHRIARAHASDTRAPVIRGVHLLSVHRFDHFRGASAPAAAPAGSIALITTPVAAPVAVAMAGDSG